MSRCVAMNFGKSAFEGNGPLFRKTQECWGKNLRNLKKINYLTDNKALQIYSVDCRKWLRNNDFMYNEVILKTVELVK